MPVAPRSRARHIYKEPYLPSFQLVLEEAITGENARPRIERWPSYVFRMRGDIDYGDTEDEDIRVYYGMQSQYLPDFDYVAPDMLDSYEREFSEDEDVQEVSMPTPVSGFLHLVKRYLRSIPEVLKSVSIGRRYNSFPLQEN
ncbi:hypothetical protein VKT23_005333 [Stygiomarasmius scandens]|uniref:Uncharacterized protein n=1 Tax=Marasmiellus scandens TaxID=2682957 RepID=A0ABR1JRA5_9AGAR